MSLATRIKTRYQTEMSRLGEDVIVRRYTGTGNSRSVSASATTSARVTGYEPHELVGAIEQGDRKIIMLAEPVTAMLPITTSDKVVVRGKELAIMAADDSSRRVGGVLIAIELQVRG